MAMAADPTGNAQFSTEWLRIGGCRDTGRNNTFLRSYMDPVAFTLSGGIDQKMWSANPIFRLATARQPGLPTTAVNKQQVYMNYQSRPGMPEPSTRKG